MPVIPYLRIRALRYGVLCCAPFFLLLCVAGCMRGTSPTPTTASPAPGASGAAQSSVGIDLTLPPAADATPGYVGNAACAGCHAAIFGQHEHSRHATTLHSASLRELGKLAPRVGDLPGGQARVEQTEDGDGYRIVVPSMDMSGPLQYALGSGKSGMTYVTLLGRHLFEMRASYFPGQLKWKTTPGQEGKARQPGMGADHTDVEAHQCILCHVTTLADGTNVPEKRFFGVGCEACHGAGGAHVAQMQKGVPASDAGVQADIHRDISMERLGQWDAKRLNELCGNCHRTLPTPTATPADPPDLRFTSRFQPYALMLSRCFKESGNRLSCITCHNPHENTSHDQSRYEAACLSCHSGSGNRQQATGNRQAAPAPATMRTAAPASSKGSNGKVCPVNARSGCIGCHMPRKQMMATSMTGTTAPDHFIRVQRKNEEAKWGRGLTKFTGSMSLGAAAP